MSAPHLIVIAAVLLMLGACDNSNLPELKGYIDKIYDRPPGPIDPLPAFEPIETFAYRPDDRRSPFEDSQALEELVEEERPTSDLAPDPTRPKQELERFPLDSLRMVGTLDQNDELWALIRSNDGILHRVTVNDYMGKDHGRITRISEDEVQLTEIVQDTMGEWMQREASIAIQQ